jgi:hypothetical protein
MGWGLGVVFGWRQAARPAAIVEALLSPEARRRCQRPGRQGRTVLDRSMRNRTTRRRDHIWFVAPFSHVLRSQSPRHAAMLVVRYRPASFFWILSLLLDTTELDYSSPSTHHPQTTPNPTNSSHSAPPPPPPPPRPRPRPRPRRRCDDLARCRCLRLSGRLRAASSGAGPSSTRFPHQQ